jgi:2-polyprenyl-6-methoxyphenol hydroxylase-like FAD-dependent oxidoreductase
MEVAVFGAGIAGLMTAIALRRNGHNCRIFERSRQAHEAGMGFILVPEGIARMEAMGVQLKGVPLERFFYRNSSGEILHDQQMPLGARSIRRRDLSTSLLEALPNGTTITFDAELDRLEFDRQGRVTHAVLSSGESVRADLYVSADGSRSRARHMLFPGWSAPLARVPELVGLVRCLQTLRWAGHDFNKFHSESGGVALGVLRVDGEHVVWYLQFDSKRFPLPPAAMVSDGIAAAQARRSFATQLVGDWADPIPHLLEGTDFTRVHHWQPVDADLIPRFHQENLVLVGDAAHPLSPFTSQGVSSAIADATTLATEIETDCTVEELPQALDRYSVTRRAQCAPYVTKGRTLMQNFLQPLAREERALLPIA